MIFLVFVVKMKLKFVDFRFTDIKGTLHHTPSSPSLARRLVGFDLPRSSLKVLP